MNVKLKTKLLKSGRISYYLTYYDPGTQKRYKEYLGLYLIELHNNCNSKEIRVISEIRSNPWFRLF
jgi:hypothetical protein